MGEEEEYQQDGLLDKADRLETTDEPQSECPIWLQKVISHHAAGYSWEDAGAGDLDTMQRDDLAQAGFLGEHAAAERAGDSPHPSEPFAPPSRDRCGSSDVSSSSLAHCTALFCGESAHQVMVPRSLCQPRSSVRHRAGEPKRVVWGRSAVMTGYRRGAIGLSDYTMLGV